MILKQCDFMGKIFCEECGTELDESMNFCSNCGISLGDDENTSSTSNEVKEDKTTSLNENSVTLKEEPKKVNKSKYSNTTKVFLGIAGVCIIIFIVGVILIGGAIMNSSTDDDYYSEDTASETLSPSFTDTIDGISFQIPKGFETFDGTDNRNMGTSITSDRLYMGPDAGLIRISVSTTQGNFYWDLSQNRAYDDVDKTINGHEGIMDAGGGFRYITDGKLVLIDGATENQLESIIIE